MSYVNPDDTGDITNISYQHLVWRFVGRQKRLMRFKELNAPKQIIEAEEDLVQKAYNQMRDKCMLDKDFVENWNGR